MNDSRGIRSDLVEKVRKIVAVLILARDMHEVEGPPGWRIHQLTGDRAGAWSLASSGNWRLTFEVVNKAIEHLEVEDYHSCLTKACARSA